MQMCMFFVTPSFSVPSTTSPFGFSSKVPEVLRYPWFSVLRLASNQEAPFHDVFRA